MLSGRSQLLRLDWSVAEYFHFLLIFHAKICSILFAQLQ